MDRHTLLVVKEGKTYDMTNLVTRVKWSGRRGAAARSLTVEMTDSERGGHGKPKIMVSKGHSCIYMTDGRERFRGMFMRQEQSDSAVMTATAYDNGIYLANNRDTFQYRDITAGEVFCDCVKRFGIPAGEIAATGHRIPELVKPATTAWDVVQDALAQTYAATGVRYGVRSQMGKLGLFERKKAMVQWVLESGCNIGAYTATHSIEAISTRLKMLSHEGSVLAEAVAQDVEARVGVFADVKDAEDGKNEAQLLQQARGLLRKASQTTQTVRVSAPGNVEVVAGAAVFLVIPELGLRRTYYVEEDAHTFERGNHTMEVGLSRVLE